MGADLKPSFVHLRSVAVLPLSFVPDFGRFCRSRGCGLRAAHAVLAQNLPHRSRDSHGFTHGRVRVFFENKSCSP
jgi:hypothetical protein